AVHRVAARPRGLPRPAVGRAVRGGDGALRVLAAALLHGADPLSGRGRLGLEHLARRGDGPGPVDEHQAPRGVWSSSVTRTRSRIDTIPSGVPPSSTTGRWRKPPWIITDAACPVESEGPIVSGPRVIQAPTSVPSTRPAATARSTSRSVRIPASRSPLSTSTAPTFRPCICCAASTSPMVGSTASSVVDITSPTVAMSVSQLGTPAVDERLQLRLQALVHRRL